MAICDQYQSGSDVSEAAAGNVVTQGSPAPPAIDPGTSGSRKKRDPALMVVVVGCGHVGLVSAACLADFGHFVVGIDRDEQRVADLRRLRLPVWEPGLDELIAKNVRAGRLAFSDDLEAAVARADVVFLAVGTAARRGDGHADVPFVLEATRRIAGALTGFTVVSTKSTLPVGTADEVAALLRATAPQADVAVVANPEFLRDGRAIADFRRPARVVVGHDDERARAMMTAVYRPLYLNAVPLHFLDRRTAELVKYAANAFLATRIALINEFTDLCEKVDADIGDLIHSLEADDRIGVRHLKPGPGFGGSSLPKDLRALIETARANRSPMRLLEAVVATNEDRPRVMVEKIVGACGGAIAGRSIAVLGLTSRPHSDDTRESPSIAIAARLIRAGAQVRVYDPEGMPSARPQLPDAVFCGSVYEAAEGSIAAVVTTDWPILHTLDLRRLARLLVDPLMIDLCGGFRRPEVTARGLRYVAIGSRSSRPVHRPEGEDDPR